MQNFILSVKANTSYVKRLFETSPVPPNIIFLTRHMVLGLSEIHLKVQLLSYAVLSHYFLKFWDQVWFFFFWIFVQKQKWKILAKKETTEKIYASENILR